MILCVCPNPALDRIQVVDRLTPGAVHRATQVMLIADGKGLNVARAAKAFGCGGTSAGVMGGQTGRQVAARAAAGGIEGAWTEVEGDTRTDVLIVDGEGVATVINEPGPVVT